jgi:hypothetical protein
MNGDVCENLHALCIEVPIALPASMKQDVLFLVMFCLAIIHADSNSAIWNGLFLLP